jgi:hypothetical protein
MSQEHQREDSRKGWSFFFFFFFFLGLLGFGSGGDGFERAQGFRRGRDEEWE